MGDSWKPIDYKEQAKTWMQPLRRGEETGMVEIPGNWDVSAADSPSPNMAYTHLHLRAR
jgi:hypothetical protein